VKYMLDTNTCIFIMKHVPEVMTHFQENTDQGISISAIVLAELTFGVENSRLRTKNQLALLNFLPLVEISSPIFCTNP
jgi:predicted nucleic acid-binding protein